MFTRKIVRQIVPLALAAGTLLSAGGISHAMPMLRPGAPPLPVETVGWRCGPGWHMNAWDRCVPNRYVPVWRVRHWHHWHPGYWRHHHWHPGYWGG